jgi:hypothetical protein
VKPVIIESYAETAERLAIPRASRRFNTLLEKSRKEGGPPPSEQCAAVLGYFSVEKFDQAWLGFLKSDSFK